MVPSPSLLVIDSNTKVVIENGISTVLVLTVEGAELVSDPLEGTVVDGALPACVETLHILTNVLRILHRVSVSYLDVLRGLSY